uniref:Uncharacterized protein n=1 Tax=Mustela putorius furo TaxID=9669 RepID=M3Y0M7_MUSPF
MTRDPPWTERWRPRVLPLPRAHCALCPPAPGDARALCSWLCHTFTNALPPRTPCRPQAQLPQRQVTARRDTRWPAVPSSLALSAPGSGTPPQASGQQFLEKPGHPVCGVKGPCSPCDHVPGTVAGKESGGRECPGEAVPAWDPSTQHGPWSPRVLSNRGSDRLGICPLGAPALVPWRFSCRVPSGCFWLAAP